MIRYLLTAEETHGFITNHLATAAAALTKWSRLEGGEGGARGRALAARILEAQSGEGWFPEYEGADPGYQSLALYYLADLQACDPCPKLEEALRRAIAFLSHFAHPDGSFGGLYGSRNTRFFCPSGVEQLAFSDPVAAGLAAFMRESIAAGRTVVLDVLDAPNLVPMFNAYCWAAAILAEREGIAAPQPALIPAQSGDSWRKEFTEAGLLVDKGSRHYTIISWHKGGVCCHWEKGTPPFVDGGVLLRSEDGVEYSTQAYRPENSVEITEGSVIVEAPYSSVSRRRPTPENFALFRLLNVTIMRFSPVREWIKRRLVGMLITGCRTLPGSNCRKIQMGLGLTIEDQIPDAVTGRFERHSPGGFHAIHMAGQGYWQRQDDEL